MRECTHWIFSEIDSSKKEEIDSNERQIERERSNTERKTDFDRSQRGILKLAFLLLFYFNYFFF